MRLVQPPGTEPAVYATHPDGGALISRSKLTVTNHARAANHDVGPTGSGRNIIWTALDEVSQFTDWITVRAWMVCADNTKNNGAWLNVRRYGGSADLAAVDNSNALAQLQYPQIAGWFQGYMTYGFIPIDANNQFEFRWDVMAFPAITNIIELFLVGYGVNGDL